MHDFCIGRDLSSTAQVIEDEGYISFLTVHGAGTIEVRNGNETSTNVVFKATVSGTDSKHFSFPYPIKARDGIHVMLNGVTATIGYFG